MKRKIIIQAEILTDDPSVDEAAVKEALSRLPAAECTIPLLFDVSLAQAPADAKHIWLYDDGDDTGPWRYAMNPEDTDGPLVSGNAVYELLSLGVCVALHCNYPRADRYGAPLLASADSYAEGAVSTYGFKVAAEGFEVSSEDSGDDTPATFWLKIAMPAGWEPR